MPSIRSRRAGSCRRPGDEHHFGQQVVPREVSMRNRPSACRATVLTSCRDGTRARTGGSAAAGARPAHARCTPAGRAGRRWVCRGGAPTHWPPTWGRLSMTWASDLPSRPSSKTWNSPTGPAPDDDGVSPITAVRSLGALRGGLGPSAGPLQAGPFAMAGDSMSPAITSPRGAEADTECPVGILCLPKALRQRRSAVCKTARLARSALRALDEGTNRDQRIS